MPYGVADKKKRRTYYIYSVRKKNFVAEFICRIAEIDISVSSGIHSTLSTVAADNVIK
jgi:hypothetical protein